MIKLFVTTQVITNKRIEIDNLKSVFTLIVYRRNYNYIIKYVQRTSPDNIRIEGGSQAIKERQQE